MMRSLRQSAWPIQFGSIFCLMVLLLGGCAFSDRARVLMPTPLALTLGVPHPGTQCLGNLTDSDIPVFVISGRNITADPTGLNPFGTKRSQIPSLGIAKVRIGDGLTCEEVYHETVKASGRKKAKVEFVEFQLSPPPTEYNPWIVKDDVIHHDGDPWVQALQQQLDNASSRDVTIFVHGYNTKFVENTLLAAEIFHYRGRQGAMISFEWPSESKLLGYIADKGNATYSTRQFRGLLSNLAKECQVDSITIIAHSAGSPIVVNAIRELRLLDYDLSPQQVREKYRIDRVVLAAPDMDLMEFLNAIHDRFAEMANGIAVYASTKDKALRFAQALYSEKRLGRSVGKLADWETEVLQSAQNIEMIDASRADKQYRNFLGHNYFHRDPWVSSDLGAFILGKLPSQRGLVREPGEVFWTFPRDYPERLEQRARRMEPSGFSDWETFSDLSPHNVGSDGMVGETQIPPAALFPYQSIDKLRPIPLADEGSDDPTSVLRRVEVVN